MAKTTNPDERIKMFRSQLKSAEEQYHRSTGSLTTEMIRLKKDFGFDFPEDAEAEITRLKAETKRLDNEVSTGLDNLKKRYGVIFDGY